MADKLRPVIIAGNWKMNKTIEEAVGFVKELAPQVKDTAVQVYLAVPYTVIKAVSDEAKETSIVVGAQNMNDASEGAFTGEIAARMLKDAGAKFVILGHSERRIYFNETNEFINKKVKKALNDGLQAILCIGETQKEKEEGKSEEVLKKQLMESLEGIAPNEMSNLILAYEPVWAIGSHLPATPEDAQKLHHYCRKLVNEKWGEESAERIVLLYGGSVKPNNAKMMLDEPDIDGLLVGGASLSAETFNQIIHYQNVKTQELTL